MIFVVTFLGKVHRSTSELDLNRYAVGGTSEHHAKDEKKKRGRSPFRYYYCPDIERNI